MKRLVHACALASLLVGCGDLTEVLVVIDTDLDVPDQIDEIRVDVIGPDGVARRSEGRIASVDELPRTLALVHRGGELGPVAVTVTGLVQGSNVVQRRARFDFVRGETRILRMFLHEACTRTRCVGDETCAGGGCRPIQVEPDELEPYDPERVGRTDGAVGDDGGVDGGTDACTPVAESCNGADDDCDSMVDEDFDLDTDMANCGSCGRMCPSDPANGSSRCAAGECQLTCDDGFLDCDPMADGCESSALAAATCGDCSTSCAMPTPLCQATEMGNQCTDACMSGFDMCGDSCVDLQSDPSHCSMCGMACPKRPNATAVCAGGSCGFECDMGFFDCDGDPANGCESQQRELDNCGACGAPCARSNGVTSCVTGTCELIGCMAGFGNCDSDDSNGCEQSTSSSLMYCGSCTNACPTDPQNGSVACVMGSCQITCDPGFADCDGMPGCESSLSSPSTCGSCAVSCDMSAPTCAPTMSGGYTCTAACMGGTECGSSCVDTMTDPLHCGMCDRICPTGPSSTPVCVGGVCDLTCDPGFEDCNMDSADGCEVDTTGDPANCGMCGMVCPGGASAACVASACTLMCPGGLGDCDGDPSNGCETDLSSSDAHCGACGNACTPGPGVTSIACMGGTCTITGCSGTLEDCDGSAGNGCEVDTDESRQNCGMCGNRCPPANRCCSGMCRTSGGGCP